MGKESVEEIKQKSDYLRGDLAQQLTNERAGFDEAGRQLMKFHGSYQQEDRETRKARKAAGLEPTTFFMVRSRIPGGRLTAEQYLVHDELADRFGNGSIRLTTRQGIQLHGVFKRNLRTHLATLNEALVSTLAACGDVERNVICCPAPVRHNGLRDELQRCAANIASHLAPRSTAYYELWLNGSKAPIPRLPEPTCDVEPIYGNTYLPRKFKTGIGLPEDNCIDLLANDAGLLARHADGKLLGFDVYAGGGMGMTHGNAKTFPRLASPICAVTPDEMIDVLTAIVKIHRDFGNREDRKLARLKYLVAAWGGPAFRDKLQAYYGRPLLDIMGPEIHGCEDHLGWHEQGDGCWWFGLHILSGRIVDTPALALRSAIRTLVKKFRPNLRITAQQNLLFCDLPAAARAAFNDQLCELGLKKVEDLPLLTRHALSCPALPTCGLALADSERTLPELLQVLQAELCELGLADAEIILRMTGCPNGCTRPYNCDIGIVGRQPGVYTVYLGGNQVGTTLGFQYADLVPQAELPNVLRPPLRSYLKHRVKGECFGDYCRRTGLEVLRLG